MDAQRAAINVFQVDLD